MIALRASLWMPLVLLAVVGCGKGIQEDGAPSASPPSASKEMKAGADMTVASAAPAEEAVRTERFRIKEGAISLRVAKIKEAEGGLRRATRELGGYVDALEGSDLDGPNATLTATVRVPVARFDLAFVKLGAIGTPLSRRVTQEDVTDQVVDLDARMKVLRAEEAAYLDILRRAKSVRDAITVRTRLGEVRQSIESMLAQRTELARRSALSKIEVTFVSVPPATTDPRDPNWGKDTASNAVGTLGAFLRGLASLGIWLAVFSPFWAIPLIVWFVMSRRARRGRPKAPPKVQ